MQQEHRICDLPYSGGSLLWLLRELAKSSTELELTCPSSRKDILPQECMSCAQLPHLVAAAVLQLLCLALHTPKHTRAVEKGDARFRELISCEQLRRQ